MTVSVYEARTKFSTLLDRVEKSDDSIIITRHNRAVAQIVPIAHGKRSTVHKELNPVIIREGAFDPLEEEWENA